MGVIAFTASMIIGLIIQVGAKLFSDTEIQQYRDAINEKKTSTADVIQLVNKIIDRSSALGASQQSAILNRLNRIFTQNAISSGLTETVTGRIKSKLSQVQDKMYKLNSLGAAYENQANNLSNAYSAFSDKEKAAAKDKQGNWTDTSAGRAGAAVEETANKAKSFYAEANALGEKYV